MVAVFSLDMERMALGTGALRREKSAQRMAHLSSFAAAPARADSPITENARETEKCAIVFSRFLFATATASAVLSYSRKSRQFPNEQVSTFELFTHAGVPHGARGMDRLADNRSCRRRWRARRRRIGSVPQLNGSIGVQLLADARHASCSAASRKHI